MQEPDIDDYYKKLAYMMKYFQHYPHLPLIIGGSDGKRNIYLSVDTSLAVCNDTRRHTCSHMPLMQGTVVDISTKKNMNTRSSTEAELLVGTNEPLPMIILYAHLFGLAQNTTINDNIIYQDNISPIWMKQNGKASCSAPTNT